MPVEGEGGRALRARGPLNLAELVQAGLVELQEVRLADAAALLAVELELLEQLAAIEQGPAPAEARERLLGYPVEPGAGDVQDYVERRLVTEYLIATGVDAALTPLSKRGAPYSHVARDASLVAIPGEVAPEAIVHRLTSCPRVLLYGLDAGGAELRGRLFRRVAAVTDAGWPERGRRPAQGASTEEPADLRALLRDLEQGRPYRPPEAEPAPEAVRRVPSPAQRRRARRIRLDGGG